MENTLQDSLTLALDIDRFMRRVHANLHPKAQMIDREKIGPLGGMVLITIAEQDAIPIQALARQLARDKAQMTRIIQSLERRKLLTRSQSTDDARVSLVSLTGKGQTLVAGFQRALAGVVDDLMSGISATERKRFAATLQKILMAAPPGEDQ